jgi:hypothetical protein
MLGAGVGLKAQGIRHKAKKGRGLKGSLNLTGMLEYWKMKKNKNQGVSQLFEYSSCFLR